jgi:ribonuclease HII
MRQKKQVLLNSESLAPGYVERWAKSRGFWPIIGVDEAGRGSLAGPVVAGALILPEDGDISGINDSKKLSAGTREALFERIIKIALAYGIAEAQVSEIDEIGILKATLLAMRRALEIALSMFEGEVGLVVVDGNVPIPVLDMRQKTWVKGDCMSINVAGASILAKVYRDRLMCEADKVYQGYGFALHKGYATKAHLEAIRRIGVSSFHRRTFSPCAMLSENSASVALAQRCR